MLSVLPGPRIAACDVPQQVMSANGFDPHALMRFGSGAQSPNAKTVVILSPDRERKPQLHRLHLVRACKMQMENDRVCRRVLRFEVAVNDLADHKRRLLEANQVRTELTLPLESAVEPLRAARITSLSNVCDAACLRLPSAYLYLPVRLR